MWQAMRNELHLEFARFDEEISARIAEYHRNGGKVHCGKGCRNCCTLAVNCTYLEALAVSKLLTENRQERVIKHALLLKSHIHEVQDLKSYLRMHRKKAGFCPLIEEDGSCGVYAVRPYSCRSLFSTKESRWCGLDFAELSTEEKQAFVESLDRNVVAFPMHYLSRPQERGSELESKAAGLMAGKFGFSIYGNLPFLLYLEQEHRLSGIIPQGYNVTMSYLEQNGLLLPYVMALSSSE